MNIFHLCLANNINAGDIALREAAQLELKKHFPEAKFSVVDLSSAKWSDNGVDFLNKHADLIVLGPGGVFLKPAKSQAQWLWDISVELLSKISVPIFAYSVGYNAFKGQEEFSGDFKQSLATLLDKSVLFTLRHKQGLKALAEYLVEDQKDKLDFNFCPTLVYPAPVSKEDYSNNSKKVAILCAGDRLKLRHKNLRAYASQIDSLVQNLKAENYEVTLVTHMKGDEWIEHYSKSFDKRIDLGGKSIKIIYDFYRGMDYVIGDRGHCQMIAYACACRVFTPVSHNKLQWFLEDTGLAKFAYAEDDSDLAMKVLNDIEDFDDDFWYQHYCEQMKRFKNISNDNFALLKESLADAKV